jgi:hypothetical protein
VVSEETPGNINANLTNAAVRLADAFHDLLAFWHLSLSWRVATAMDFERIRFGHAWLRWGFDPTGHHEPASTKGFMLHVPVLCW